MILWPHKPLVKSYREVMQFKTDVLEMYNSEQRIALRVVPRTEYTVESLFVDVDYADIQTQFMTQSNSEFAMPAWADGTVIAGVTATDTEILFDTSYADYYADGYVAVVGDDGTAAMATIDTVLSDRVTLTAGFPITIGSARVYPAKAGYFYDGIKIKKEGPVTYVEGVFTTVEGVDLSAATSYDTYDSLTVYSDAFNLFSSIDESIERKQTLLDNGSGIIETDTVRDYLDKQFTLNAMPSTMAARWAFRVFLHNLKGRRGAFWMPTFNNDLTLIDNITSGTATLDVESVDFETYGDEIAICIFKDDGSRVYNTVTSGVAITGGERLTCNANFAADVLSEDVTRISYMHKVRLDSDRIGWTYLSHLIAQVSIPCKMVLA